MSIIIKSLDLFGENIKIYFNKQEKIQTAFGGYLSLFIFALTLVMVWFIGKDLIYKSNPFNYQQQIIHKSYLNTTINKTTFPIAFAFVDNGGAIVKNISRYLTYELSYNTYNYDNEGKLGNSTIEKFDIVDCQYDDFPSLSHEYFDALLSTFQCPQMNSSFISGYWSESSIRSLTAVVKLCDFDVAENNCYSHEEINDFIAKTGLSITLIVLEPIVMIDNYFQPVHKYAIAPYKYLTEDLKIVDYFVERNVIYTDAGVLFESIETEEFLKLKEMPADVSIFDKKEKKIFEYSFYSSNIQTIYFRKYIKIPEILASVGGLFKLFTLIGYFINVNFSRISKNLTTISCLFEIEGGNSDIINMVNRPINTQKLIIKTSQKNVINQNCSNIELKRNLKEKLTSKNEPFALLNKIKLRRPAYLNLSVSDYFRLIFKRKKNQSKNVYLYEKALMRIQDYFDIIFIINKLIEVEIIKDLLLTDSQKHILENIKPLLNEDKNVNERISKDEFHQILINLITSRSNTEFDNKLIQILTTFH